MNLSDFLFAHVATEGNRLRGERERTEQERQRKRQEQADMLDIYQLQLAQQRAERERQAAEQRVARDVEDTQYRRYQDQKENRRAERRVRAEEQRVSAEAEADRALAANRQRATQNRTPRPRRPLNSTQINRAGELRGELGTSPRGTPVNPDALNRAVYERMVREGSITDEQVPEGVEPPAPQSQQRRQYRPENPFR